ncbi:site-specific DNA-methyltransferase [Glaesserella parasuis]|uniref:site-specific DNA-methyltransferase n=1 Tax=Glaesserella parasuis TaxID=738 RepID=UPI00243735E2|nr:site-specific DNA-methyltransferase [Glaesserella parasuis]MDG6448466.1 site-specific DNA-methyltransferase [Glaesserella parasuis]MDG6476325.1 site-specific DNA-methyltransferase [Glaesserella parasuis]
MKNKIPCYDIFSQKNAIIAQNFNDNGDTMSQSLLDLLKAHNPELFDKEGNFKLADFRTVLAEADATFSQETYRLDWRGKSYAKALVYDENRTLLSANHSHNANNLDSQNVLIQGDNLAVLKHLREAYRKQIKMIYIDPPYNTGSDGFVYQDDRKYTPEQIAQITGESEEYAEYIHSFINARASSHSAWLTFMYPRLKLARELLKDDGVIFISIDDNEQAQLKLLCDEIFGEGNFIKDLIINTSEGGGNAKYVVNGHETLLVYARDISLFDNLKRPKDIRGKKIMVNNELYWIQEDAIREEFGKYGNLHYEDIVKVKGENFKLKIDNGIKNNEYVLLKKSNGKHIIGKLRKVSDDFSKFHSILNIGNINKHLTANGIRELEELFISEKGKSPFETPKPLDLLKRVILSSTFKGNENDLILDFFAGSGTTAHAVMQLNSEDNGNRKFICVQLDEPVKPKSEAEKAGFNTIFEITKARIEKSIEKIKKENPDFNGDLGFKEYKIVPTPDNFGILADNPAHGLTLLENLQLSDTDCQNILTTWCVQDGMLLHHTPKQIDLGGYIAYRYDTVLYLLNKGFDTKHLAVILRRLDDTTDEFNIDKIVILEPHFDSKAKRELTEAIGQYKPRKGNKLYLVVRNRADKG